MNGSTRRTFLLSALTLTGAAAFGAIGLLRRGATRILIPVKPIDRRRLREPNDLAG